MMNNILAIDTSGAKCTVAISSGDFLYQRSSELDRQSAQRVLPMIAELLRSAELQLSELDLIAVMAGPGSFTGLRIGIGVAQGLSMANSTPVIPISTLAAKAMAAIGESEVSSFLVCEEARAGEVFFAAYQQSESLGVRLLGNEQVAIPMLLQMSAEAKKLDAWCAVGGGWAQRAEIQANLACELLGEAIDPEVAISDLIELAKLRHAAGESLNAEQLRPNYVKEHLDYA